MLLVSLQATSQNDTLKKDTITSDFQISIANRNYCRGGMFGGGVAAMATIEASYKNFTLGTFAIYSPDLAYNYGRGVDAYFAYKIKKMSISFHDYFFFNKDYTVSDFFYTTGHGSGKEGHYLELDAKYSTKRFTLLAAYNFYNTTMEMYKTTVYLESEYKFSKNYSLVAGFTTSPSVVNFYGDTYNRGINFTHVGINAVKKLKDCEIKAMMHINPNYKNFDASLQRTPYTFILQFTI